MSPRLLRKRSSFEAGIDADQPADELPCRLKKQSQGSAQSDPDINALILSQKRERQRRGEEARRKGEWIRRDPIKCCVCDTEILGSRMCFCSHVFCVFCFYYDKDPLLAIDKDPLLAIDCEIPDAEHDELWKEVRESPRCCREERESDSV